MCVGGGGGGGTERHIIFKMARSRMEVSSCVCVFRVGEGGGGATTEDSPHASGE